MASAHSCHAQDTHEWTEAMPLYPADDDTDVETMKHLQEDWDALKDAPFNLNTATREQIESLFFLSPTQQEALAAYLYFYSPLRSWGELVMVDALDSDAIRHIRACTFIAPPPPKGFPSIQQLWKEGKHQIFSTLHLPLTDKQQNNQNHRGYPLKHWWRYQYQHQQNLKIALVAAQDAGEPFFAKPNTWGYDYYGGYILVHPRHTVETIVLGNYRVKTGLGLVVNTSPNIFTQRFNTSLANTGAILSGHSSRLSAHHLSGMAATFRLPLHLRATVFTSYRAQDATLTSNQQAVSTLLHTGYHRTNSEILRKNNLHEWLVGGHLAYHQKHFQAGITALCHGYDLPLQPDSNTVRLYFAPRGNIFWSLSVNYGYLHPRWFFQGEVATGNHHAPASLHLLGYNLSSRTQFQLLHRFYSYRYYALHGNSFASGKQVSNEQGIYGSLRYKPHQHVTLLAYLDYAYHPWLRYGVDNASQGFDFGIQTTLQILPQLTVKAYYRYRLQQKNSTTPTLLVNQNKHHARLSSSYQTKQWQLSATLHLTNVSPASSLWGWAATTQATRKWHQGSMHTAITYFHTNSYTTRIYTYTPGLRYEMSFPMLYGHGLYAAMHTAWNLSSHWYLAATLSGKLLFSHTPPTQSTSKDTIIQQTGFFCQQAHCALQMAFRW